MKLFAASENFKELIRNPFSVLIGYCSTHSIYITGVLNHDIKDHSLSSRSIKELELHLPSGIHAIGFSGERKFLININAEQLLGPEFSHLHVIGEVEDSQVNFKVFKGPTYKNIIDVVVEDVSPKDFIQKHFLTLRTSLAIHIRVDPSVASNLGFQSAVTDAFNDYAFPLLHGDVVFATTCPVPATGCRALLYAHGSSHKETSSSSDTPTVSSLADDPSIATLWGIPRDCSGNENGGLGEFALRAMVKPSSFKHRASANVAEGMKAPALSLASPSLLVVAPAAHVHEGHKNSNNVRKSMDMTSAPAISETLVLLDVIAYVRTDLAAATVANQLLASLKSQLSMARHKILHREKLLSIHWRQFLPMPALHHHVSAAFPVLHADYEIDTAAIANVRRRLHVRLGLSTDLPLFRGAQALVPPSGLDFALAAGQLPPTSETVVAWPAGGAGSKETDGKCLLDVHLGIASPPLPFGEDVSLSVVSGSYEYRHYLQDGEQDAGWGCAYRSLQTLCSWLRIQGLTHRQAPSHAEIQSTLVRLGDKPASFAGSRSWIGAIEVGFVLEALLGVQGRVLSVPRGADVSTLARELSAHFRNGGAPVMVGGGVLAYTLLGVQHCESTGEAAFLILDPHYTGSEDLARIQKGGWVAWRRPGDSAAAGGPLFVEDAFYNFLCPVIPKGV